MSLNPQSQFTKRYQEVSEKKAGGATYTPQVLADFVAEQMIALVSKFPTKGVVRILDPAVGDGELLISLLKHLPNSKRVTLEVYGFEMDESELRLARKRVGEAYPDVQLRLENRDFLEFVLGNGDLFRGEMPDEYDFIIANPPYVRTQIMGAEQAQRLAKQFGLSGRVDLYYPFLLGMASVLKPKGIAGIIVSNRFMTTKSGATVRQELSSRFNLKSLWDLGDTKLFDAAVLPAVLIAEGKNGHAVGAPAFSSIYETSGATDKRVENPIQALAESGVVGVSDGRNFEVQHGVLDTGGTPGGVWRVATQESDSWLKTVQSNSWGDFRKIGKIRVGVKTCADKVFIRSDWDEVTDDSVPELLKPLVTHHAARRFRQAQPKKEKKILYPHVVVDGKRSVVDLKKYPLSRKYLEGHKKKLEGRKYVIEAGRQWYEIWVPQDPAAWDAPKLVFRDISEEPTFWIDKTGAVVNGDCYWLTCEDGVDEGLLWLAAAVANSTFIEVFYDHMFRNKLYAGRRRYITQYVEKFPLPDPQSKSAKQLVKKAQQLYNEMDTAEAEALQSELDALVWKAFGLLVKKVTG